MNFKQQAVDLVYETYVEAIGMQMGNQKEAASLLVSMAKQLLDPNLPPKELGLTYATIKYWETKGYLILPIQKEVAEWRKYCLLEFYWFQILKKVATMGCSLDIVVPKIIAGYSKLSNYNIEILFKEIIADEDDNIQGVQIAPLVTFLGHVIRIITKRSKAGISLYDESCRFYFEKEMNLNDITNQASEMIFKNAISISISDIIFEYSLRWQEEKKTKIEILSKEELEILMLLKKKELKELTIILKDGKPINLVLKEILGNKDAMAKRLQEFFFTPYQEIRAVTNGDKEYFIERVTKKKLN